jgi:hypothetical protein
VCLDKRGAERNQSEGEDKEWNPESRSNCLEDDVGWNFDAVMDVSAREWYGGPKGTYAIYVK